jgi:hypothetical protein
MTDNTFEPILQNIYFEEIPVVNADVVRQFNKFDRDDWNKIDVEPSNENEKNVINMLVNLGENTYECMKNNKEITNDNIQLNKYECMGDEYYIMSKNYYEHILFENFKKTKGKVDKVEEKVNKIKKNKKDKKPLIKKDEQIKMLNSLNKIHEQFNNISDSLSLDRNKKELDNVPNILINNKILEIKGLTWILFGAILGNNVKSYTTTKNLPIALSMITGMIKFVSVCSVDGILIKCSSVINKNKETTISNQLLIQIKEWIDYLIQIYPYNGLTICRVARHLLSITEFSNAIPSGSIKPRKFQNDIMIECSNNYENGFFFGLNPTIGVGKTSSVLSYGKFLLTTRQNIGGYHFAIYACDTDAVRKQVCTYCYNGKIPFAIAISYRDKDTGNYKFKIIPNNNCMKKEENIIIVICDTLTCMQYIDHLKTFEPEKFAQCTLLLDEPTNGSDIRGSSMLDNVCNILTKIPKRTMLISATLPKFEDIPNIIDHVNNKYCQCCIKTISSNEIQIGCSVYTMDKIYVTPFSGCKTQEDILYAINIVSSNPFLSRLCTIEVVMMLWEKMNEMNISDLENLNETFADPINMSPSQVHNTCIRFLKKLSTQSSNIIEIVCNTKILTKENIVVDDEKKDNNDELIIFEKNIKQKIMNINYYELVTGLASKFKSQTLVAVGDPIQFSNKYFGRLYRDVINSPCDPFDDTKGKFGSIKNAVRRYETALSLFNSKKESLERNIQGGSMMKSKTLQEFDDKKPSLNITPFGIVNSKAHSIKYGLNGKVKSEFERYAFSLDEINPMMMNTPDWIVTLLFCGIGIYSENNQLLCQTYKNTVSNLGSMGKLAFVISDDTICYGTNWPFTCVIVDNSFVNVIATLKTQIHLPIKRSINTIMQLLGRAGRFFKSWEATAYVTDEIANMILEYSQNKNYIQCESINIKETFEEKLNEYHNNLQECYDLQINPKLEKKIKHCGISVVKTEKHKIDLIDDLIDDVVIDVGGYFILNGSEKTILSQDRMVENIIENNFEVVRSKSSKSVFRNKNKRNNM